MTHVYEKNQLSRGYQSIFMAEAKTLQSNDDDHSGQEPIELLTACRKCSNILMEEKVQLES